MKTKRKRKISQFINTKKYKILMNKLMYLRDLFNKIVI